jgi:hypothetical protein
VGPAHTFRPAPLQTRETNAFQLQLIIAVLLFYYYIITTVQYTLSLRRREFFPSATIPVTFQVWDG